MKQSQPQSSQYQQSRLGASHYGSGLVAGGFNTYGNEYSTIGAGQQSETQLNDSFEKEAFEKAFDAASLELHGQEAIVRHEDTVDPPLMTGASNGFEDRTYYRIGSDRILDESQQHLDNRSNEQEADELAKTAGQLLENVKHDQSAKFQGSNFLSLMRQLRDKEVRIEGDNFVDVSMLCL